MVKIIITLPLMSYTVPSHPPPMEAGVAASQPHDLKVASITDP
jgi:hypothetical protein